MAVIRSSNGKKKKAQAKAKNPTTRSRSALAEKGNVLKPAPPPKHGLSLASRSTYTSNALHGAEDPILRCELRRALAYCTPFDDFMTVFSGDWESSMHRADNLSYLKTIVSAETSFKVATPESKMYSPFVQIANRALKDTPFHCLITNNHKGMSGAVDRRPDIVLVHCCCANQPCERKRHIFPTVESLTWEDVLIPIEIKPTVTVSRPPKVEDDAEGASGSADPIQEIQGVAKEGSKIRLNPREQVAGYAAEVLSAAPFRHYTLAMLVSKRSIEMWYYDRQGTIGSEECDFSASVLLAVFTSFGLGSSHTFGFNPVFVDPSRFSDECDVLPLRDLILHSTNQSRTRLIDIQIHKINLAMHPTPLLTSDGPVIHAQAHPPRVLFGRGTAVFPCSFTDIPTSGVIAQRVVKLSWQFPSRKSEVDFLKEAQGIKGIPILRAHKDIFNLEDDVRGILHSILKDGFIGSVGDRVYRAIVLEPYCVPLHSVKDVHTFLKAFGSLVTTHYELYEHRKILHRDINPNNLMVDAGNPERGVLIDLDFASWAGDKKDCRQENDQAHNDRTQHFTMSTPFLAVDLLSISPPEHLYRHDLESFFWTIVWIAVLYEEGLICADNLALQLWHVGNYEQIRSAKVNELSNLSYLQHISSTFDSPAFRGLLEKFALILLLGYERMKQPRIVSSAMPAAEFIDGGGYITYGAFMKAIIRCLKEYE